MDFFTARRACHLLLAAVFTAVAALVIPAPAAAKHGEGGGSEGGHDQGRHLGWYKHGGPAFIERGYSGYSGAWGGPRAWGGGAWGWQGGVIAGSAAWGVAWGLGPRFAFFCPAGRLGPTTGLRRSAPCGGERALAGGAGTLLRCAGGRRADA